LAAAPCARFDFFLPLRTRFEFFGRCARASNYLAAPARTSVFFIRALNQPAKKYIFLSVVIT
jgi:hypothetical protein